MCFNGETKIQIEYFVLYNQLLVCPKYATQASIWHSWSAISAMLVLCTVACVAPVLLRLGVFPRPALSWQRLQKASDVRKVHGLPGRQSGRGVVRPLDV
jgi:hypothetical protein